MNKHLKQLLNDCKTQKEVTNKLLDALKDLTGEDYYSMSDINNTLNQRQLDYKKQLNKIKISIDQ